MKRAYPYAVIRKRIFFYTGWIYNYPVYCLRYTLKFYFFQLYRTVNGIMLQWIPLFCPSPPTVSINNLQCLLVDVKSDILNKS